MDNKLLEKMAAKLIRLISDEDSVRIYALCAKCAGVVRVMGRGEITKDEDVFIL